jgi:hypothetical protein
MINKNILNSWNRKHLYIPVCDIWFSYSLTWAGFFFLWALMTTKKSVHLSKNSKKISRQFQFLLFLGPPWKSAKLQEKRLSFMGNIPNLKPFIHTYCVFTLHREWGFRFSGRKSAIFVKFKNWNIFLNLCSIATTENSRFYAKNHGLYDKCNFSLAKFCDRRTVWKSSLLIIHLLCMWNATSC